MYKVDFHAHTRYSPDSTMSPAELVARARDAGLDRIAVTDHNCMDGAFEAWSLAPELVILGEEVDCADGTDLIGLYLMEPIPGGLSVQEVAERIRDQGGIVYAPHPFAYVRSQSVRALRALEVADIVEVFNARAFAPSWNRRAARAAQVTGLAVGAGTDAHFPHEVGNAYTEVDAFANAHELRAALRSARPVGVRTAHPLIHVRSITTEVVRRTWWATLGNRPVFEEGTDVARLLAVTSRESAERGAA